MARNSLELKSTLSLPEFYRLSKQVAVYYSKTVPSTARTKIMEKFDLTESTFYTLLEMAITHHLVNDNVVEKIREKILANQAAHGNTGYHSNVKHNKLKESRKNYSAFSKKDILYIATYFAEHPDKSKSQISKFFSFTNSKVLDQLLKKACLELIISDKVYKQIVSRSISTSTNLNATMAFFEELTRKRIEAKEQKQDTKTAF